MSWHGVPLCLVGGILPPHLQRNPEAVVEPLVVPVGNRVAPMSRPRPRHCPGWEAGNRLVEEIAAILGADAPIVETIQALKDANARLTNAVEDRK